MLMFRVLALLCASSVWGLSVDAWPVEGMARVWVDDFGGGSGNWSVSAGSVLVLTAADDARLHGWVLVPAGSVACDADGGNVGFVVAAGESWVASFSAGGVWTFGRVSSGDVWASLCAGFGLGLGVFGFGWILRLVRRIPE
jgi:hypothetical protein